MKDGNQIVGVIIKFEDGTAIELLDNRGGDGDFMKRKLNPDGYMLKESRVGVSTVKQHLQKITAHSI